MTGRMTSSLAGIAHRFDQTVCIPPREGELAGWPSSWKPPCTVNECITCHFLAWNRIYFSRRAMNCRGRSFMRKLNLPTRYSFFDRPASFFLSRLLFQAQLVHTHLQCLHWNTRALHEQISITSVDREGNVALLCHAWGTKQCFPHKHPLREKNQKSQEYRSDLEPRKAVNNLSFFTSFLLFSFGCRPLMSALCTALNSIFPQFRLRACYCCSRRYISFSPRQRCNRGMIECMYFQKSLTNQFFSQKMLKNKTNRVCVSFLRCRRISVKSV